MTSAATRAAYLVPRRLPADERRELDRRPPTTTPIGFAPGRIAHVVFALASTMALTISLVACGRGNDTARDRALDDPPARRLVGAWDARFRADTPATPARAEVATPRAPAAEARGTIALVEDRTGTAYPDVPLALHAGAYDVDFRPLGFEPRVAGAPPVAVATPVAAASGAQAPDSVVVVLSPQTSGRGGGTRSVVLRGRLAGDSVAGRWLTGGVPPFGTRGTFVLRRLR